ncbi:InlB B-repeat-containing protein [Yeguia hominis]|uniref:InlB B-repeat-containing protein n=1 Tax=Yeguia hominis TaxID=2763662 RepID=A0A926D4Z2_9FIRM|nr:InlB B-repeat-containing protein [Yeguia hominis]MBC8532510.1 InlB B-repeat-containing protein [Yeguia hominis]
MKKRFLSILLTLCLVLCLAPITVFAEGETEAAPGCSCETACTAEARNTDCPVCGADGALAENCGKYTEPETEGESPKPEEANPQEKPEGGMPEAHSKAVPVLMSGETEIRSESELESALDDETRAEIKLGGNIEISGGFIISRAVTLDLNGYTLTSSGTEFDIFSVHDNGNLTIKDSGTGGKIDGQNKNCGFSIYGGVLTLESGTIINCTDADGDGGAVDIASGSSEGVKTYGKFVMNGGAIKNCTAGDDGGAVDIGKGCTFMMNGGTISGCRADDDAGAVFIKQKASFVMNGGTIENCSAFCGGAVNIYRDGSFAMTGGTIKDCTVDAGGFGNAVYGKHDEAIVVISGGAIENCGVSPLSFDAFTVSFDSDGGTPVADQQVLNAPAVRPDDPAKPGYLFEDWYIGETPFDFSVSVNKNTMVMAKWSACDHAGSTAQPTCTDSALCTICNGTIPAKGHALTWQSKNGACWQTCSNCDFETAKKAIPEITILGSDKVCRTQDYEFTFTLPEGCKNPTYGYEFLHLGDSGISPTFTNGVYSGTVTTASYYDATDFKVTVYAETADGFPIRAEKAVAILNEHTGGTATCKKKPKCAVCGAEYGELNPDHHTGLKHFPAKAATKNAEGNIEYWYCADCNTYYSDAAARDEISKADTIIKKLADDRKTPQTGDSNNLMLWFALLVVSGGAVIGATVTRRKKTYNR